jgi:small subunit ribosomal protein S21
MNKNKNSGIMGTRVVVGENMPINTALRKFKQKVDDAGILETLRKKMFYEKPTATKKRKRGAARARWLKRLRDQELPKKMY